MMSNDLISRSALIEKIKKWLPSDPCGKEQSIEEVVSTDLAVSMLMEIEEAPTAYDVDEVCQEIKRMMFEEASIEGIKIANKAIEIARNGGAYNA